uniref:Uncharacterized protein n=1 Tax=Arundo donax TaxID=35708 RepID=A0A0A8YJE0_ARUDO
MLSCWKGYI